MSIQRWIRKGSLCLSLWIASWQPGLLLLGQTVPEAPRPRMNIAVVQGEGTINNVRERKTTNVVVIVRDGNRRPLPQASVTFSLPTEGASAKFPNGAATLTVESDKDGYATASGIVPNTVPGPYRIAIEAKHGEETVTATMTQFNMAVESRGGSGKWVALVAVVGAAAAGGVVALTRNGSTATATPATPIGITPGSGTVGPPR